jgi:rhodanese-related sulfurtransferase
MKQPILIECDVHELQNDLSAGLGNLIDVREFPEFAGGRVPQAKLISLGEIEKRTAEIDHSRTVYVMCRSGRRSAQARKKLHALGFADVRNVRGGFDAWKNAGFEVEKDDKTVWSLERQVRFTAGLTVFLSVLLSVFVWSPLIWIGGFVGAGLVFAAITDTCGMALMLAKLPWNRSQTCGVDFANKVS